MAAQDELVERLRKFRPDYERERAWCKFLLDAYTGGGGFAGRIEPPAISTLGWVAEAYGMVSGDFAAETGQSESYLDQYPREDSYKYAARVAQAHYSNFVETIADLLVSYVLKQAPTYENIPSVIEEWSQNVTPQGAGFSELRRHVLALHSALMGWCPTLIDRDPIPEGVSQARAREAGARMAPWLVPLTPANLLDWYADDDGILQWVKVRIDYRRNPDPLGAAQSVEQYKIFDRFGIRTWEVVEDKVVSESEAAHPFGEVPIVSFKHKPAFGERMRGASMVGDAARACRRLFNLESEIDEHIRSVVFAILQVPVMPGEDPPAELVVGNGNALAVPANATQGYAFVSPDGSVAETLERRAENLIREMMRRARAAFGQKSAGANQSGTSKAWDFEETNRLLGDFAAQLADGELAVYRKVARLYDISDDAIAAMRVHPATQFAVEDLAEELENAELALALHLGNWAEMLIKRRVAHRVLPNMTSEDSGIIEDELLTQAKGPEQDAAEELEIEAAQADDPEQDTGPGSTEPDSD